MDIEPKCLTLAWLAACLPLACGGSDQASASVAPPPVLSLTVAVTSTASLAFVGAQDGDGAWTAVPASSAQDNVVSLANDRYGVAYGCAAAGTTTIHVLRATLEESVRVEVSCGDLAQASPVTISGSVLGLSAGQSAQIDAAGSSAQVSAAPGSYTLDVPQGSHDAFARRFTSTPLFDTVIRRNDVAFAAGGTLDFDFATEGASPDSNLVTVKGTSATETTEVLVNLRSPSGSSFSLGVFPPDAVLTLPESMLRADDVHSVVVSASDTTAGSTRTERRLLRAGQAFTPELPSLPPLLTLSVGNAQPYLRPKFSIPRLFAGDFYDVTLSQATSPVVWEITLTQGQIGGTTSYTVPDLSALPLFDVNWALVSGVPISIRQYAEKSTLHVKPLLEPSTPLLVGAVYESTLLSGEQAL